MSVQLLPRAEFDLILFWLASRRGLLRGRVEEGGLFEKYAAKSGRGPMELGVEEKVKLLIMERIKMNVDVRGKWQDVSFLSLSFLLLFNLSFSTNIHLYLLPHFFGYMDG